MGNYTVCSIAFQISKKHRMLGLLNISIIIYVKATERITDFHIHDNDCRKPNLNMLVRSSKSGREEDLALVLLKPFSKYAMKTSAVGGRNEGTKDFAGSRQMDQVQGVKMTEDL